LHDKEKLKQNESLTIGYQLIPYECADAIQMEAPIPQEWLKPVLRILRDGKFGREILYPERVRNDWDAHTLGTAFLWDVREPLIQALSMPGVIGKLEPDQPEPGVTYAFWFHFKVGEKIRRFYGKICLYNDKVKIKLLSAHLPDKGEEYL
jgi:hypothetical protein